MKGYWIVGTVPFGCSCARCGTFDSDAGAYWEHRPPTDEQWAEIRGRYLCTECDQHRRRIGETVEQFVAGAVK